MQTSQQLNKPKFFYRASSIQRKVAAIICLGIIVFFASFALAGRYKIDMGRWLGYCGFKQRTGLPCPTCGMTTATLAFARGRVFQAFYIQPAAALIWSLLTLAAFLALLTALFGVYFRFLGNFLRQVRVKWVLLALAVIVGAAWAVTLARALAQNATG